MRLLIHLCNQRVLTSRVDHMWPISEKIKKIIPTNKLIVKESKIEDYGWPRSKNIFIETKKQMNDGSGSSI